MDFMPLFWPMLLCWLSFSLTGCSIYSAVCMKGHPTFPAFYFLGSGIWLLDPAS
jgi:hypothetical protein